MVNTYINFNRRNLETRISKNSIDYLKAIKFMEKRVENIINKKESELVWMLLHPSIYTAGTTSQNSDFIRKTKIPIYKTNRGGQITYHGPGQRVIYLMIDLRKKKDVRSYVNLLEKTIIESLKEFNIISESRRDRIGIWVIRSNGKNLIQEKKIASIGIRIKKWITYHGISVNIDPNLKYFKYINPCGIKNCQVTSLKDLDIKINVEKFDKVFLDKFNKFLNF